MNPKIEYVAKSLTKGKSKHYETFIINQIYARLNNPNIEIATQQYVYAKDKTVRFIDLYFPQIFFGVEIDEPYHDTFEQTERDKAREENIKEAVLESTVIEGNKKIVIERIGLSKCKDLTDLYNKIDEIVKKIKEKVKETKIVLVWDLDEKTKQEEIKKRGYLQRGDSFRIMADIIKMFHVDLKSDHYQKCSYKLTDKLQIWSPTLSVEGSDRGGWVNTIANDLSVIYESNKDSVEIVRNNARYHQEHDITRIVFLKYKDALGNRRRRFLGVYHIEGFDEERKGEIWKLVDETISLNCNK